MRVSERVFDELWKNYFDANFHGFDDFKQALKMTFLSALVQKKDTNFIHHGEKISPKTNLLVIAPPSAGKNTIVGKLRKIIKALGPTIPIALLMETDLTEASLIGTSKQIREKGTVRFEAKEGSLKHADIYYIPEAKVLFENARVGKAGLQTALLNAADNPGRIVKNLASLNQPIEYNVKCSMLFTTTPFDELNHTILNSGFGQRFGLIFGEPTQQEFLQNRQHGFTENTNDFEKEATILQKLIEHLNTKTIYSGTVETTLTDQQMKTLFSLYTKVSNEFNDKQLRDWMDSYNNRHVQQFKSQLTTLAAFNNRSKFNEDDFNNALEISNIFYDNFIQLLATIKKDRFARDEFVETVYTFFSKRGLEEYTGQQKLVEELRPLTKIGIVRLAKNLQTAAEAGYLTTEKNQFEANVTTFRINKSLYDEYFRKRGANPVL
jgi:hypothetical protein